MSYVESRKQILHSLRSKQQGEKNRFHMLKTELEVFHPKEWKILAEAITTIFIYYRTEMVRCKHDTANYMKGFDNNDVYGDSPVIPGMLDIIARARQQIKDVDVAAEKYRKVEDNPIEAGGARLDYETEVDTLKSTLEELQKTTKKMRGEYYGRQ